MKDPKLFRPKAVESSQAREEFQRAIRILTPKSWIYLVIFILLYGAAFIWLLFGSIATIVQGKGMIYSSNPDSEVVAFLDVDVGKNIRAGMPVTVFPKHISALEFGGIEGRVNFISEFPVSPKDLEALLHNQKLVDDFMEQGPVYEVKVGLIRSSNTATGYRWTTSKGPKEAITLGSIVDVSIVTETERPIYLITRIAKSTINAD